MNIANCLTFIRIFISPIFPLLYLEHESLGISYSLLPYLLIFLLGLSELSDFLDGYLARKYDQVTNLGKILDPIADSINHLTVFFSFTTGVIKVPLLLVFPFFYRLSIISTLRTLCALKGIALGARLSGKIKTVIQGISALVILLFMIPHSMELISDSTLRTISISSISVAITFTLFATIDYLYANKQYLTQALKT